MKFLILAAVVALTSAWTPGVRDQCNRDNINGGSLLLPHERYCQLFYTCDLEGNQTPLYCPGRLLFAYGIGIATCVPSDQGFTSYSCPKWPCNSPNDIGRRYPDTCCDKYWECTAINTFSEKVCTPGSSFDTQSEICTPQASCTSSEYCVDNFRPSSINDCRDSATSDPCAYRSQGWPFDRQCPVGTAFDTSTCSCSQFNQGCTASGISAEVLIENKRPDQTCRASGRIDFSNNGLNVVSDKLSRNIDHYFYRASGFSVNGLEGVFTTFDANNNQNVFSPFIYDYFYNDNTLYAPLAIVMSVRFDLNNIQLGTSFNLLENRWTVDPSNTHCQTSLRISARYQGIQLGDRSWEFQIFATGETLVDSSGTATIRGNANDYFRIVFTFGAIQNNVIGIGGSVSNRGQSGQIQSGQAVNFVTDNRSLGSALKPNKCGFALGRNLDGRIREFSVHEGCSSFAGLG